MPLTFNVDSVVPGGLFITVYSFDTGYSQTDAFDVAIVDGGPTPPGGTGQNTGIMTKVAPFGATAPTASLFFSWYDLVGYTPEIVGGNETTITIQDSTVGGNSTPPESYPNSLSYFPWPISGGGGGAACFTSSSALLTPTGYKAAKDIKTGDIVLTEDGRQVAVTAHSFTVNYTTKETAPFFIPKHSLGHNSPKTDMHLSPWHAIQIKKGLWMKPMSALELGLPVQQYDLNKSVTYYHFETSDYFQDNFICEGTVVESFGGNQTANLKTSVYKYNPTLKGYTRLGKTQAKKSLSM